MFIVWIIVAFLVAGFVDASLRQKYNIARNKTFSDQFFNRYHMLFEIFAVLAFLALVSTVGFPENVLYSVLVLFFAFLYMIRTLLEFTFRKQTNKHKISLVYVVIFTILSAGIYLFM